jgi:hypothetical protein
MKRLMAQQYRSEILLIALLMAMLAVIVLSVADVFAGGPAAGDGPWADDLRTAGEALAAGNVGVAEWAWRHAWAAALRSRRWDGMLAVGGAALAIGEGTHDVRAGRAQARRAYLAALFRAREARSVDGIVRAAEAFLDLGDREVAQTGLGMALALLRRTPDEMASARVQALADRLGDRSIAAGPMGLEP